MKKIPKQAYTTEFKELAVKRVSDGQAIVATAKELGLNEQTLRNWVKAAAAGKLAVAGSKAVTPEAMELSRLRAENARLKRENEIIKNVWSAPDLQAVFADVRRTFCVNVSGLRLGTLVPGLDGIRTRPAS